MPIKTIDKKIQQALARKKEIELREVVWRKTRITKDQEKEISFYFHCHRKIHLTVPHPHPLQK